MKPNPTVVVKQKIKTKVKIITPDEEPEGRLANPAEDVSFSDKELAAAAMIVSLKAGYRAAAFERAGLGAYGIDNPHVESLAKKGVVEIRGKSVIVNAPVARAVLKRHHVPEAYRRDIDNPHMLFKAAAERAPVDRVSNPHAVVVEGEVPLSSSTSSSSIAFRTAKYLLDKRAEPAAEFEPGATYVASVGPDVTSFRLKGYTPEEEREVYDALVAATKAYRRRNPGRPVSSVPLEGRDHDVHRSAFEPNPAPRSLPADLKKRLMDWQAKTGPVHALVAAKVPTERLGNAALAELRAIRTKNAADKAHLAKTIKELEACCAAHGRKGNPADDVAPGERVQSVKTPAQRGKLVEILTRGDGTRLAYVDWDGPGYSPVRVSDLEPETSAASDAPAPSAHEEEPWHGFGAFAGSRLARGRAIAALNQTMTMNRGKVARTGEHVERMVSEGYRVVDDHGRRVLQHPDGRFVEQRALSKVALDYADFLSSRQERHGNPAGDAEAHVRRLGGKVKFEDRSRRAQQEDREAGPRWTAFVTVFGHDRSGEGDTKDAAVSAAVNDLPGHVARHFAPARHGNPPRKSAKERTLGMFDEPAATEPSARRGTRERTYREPPRGPQLDLPIGGTQVDLTLEEEARAKRFDNPVPHPLRRGGRRATRRPVRDVVYALRALTRRLGARQSRKAPSPILRPRELSSRTT
jgi:hypothetical protein